MKIGFTGTQRGMTTYQKEIVRRLLIEYCPDEVHHGDCKGGDAEFHQIAKEVGIKEIHIHPPIDVKLRAFCNGPGVIIHHAKPYIERNRDIVNGTDRLIGCPRNFVKPKDFRGEGTWSTIHFAETKAKKPVDRVYIYPTEATFD